MALLITSENRSRYARLVDDMHFDRKRVFVDKLNWDVPVVDGCYEIDEFDTEDALYLIAMNPQTGRHLASVRLLPTTRPHLMDKVFPTLVSGAIPKGPDVWELSRLCTAPETPKDVAVFARGRLLLSLLELAVEKGVTRLTAVCQLKFLSTLLSVGWDCEPLGMPQELDGEVVGAILIHVNARAIALLRERFDLPAAA